MNFWKFKTRAAYYTDWRDATAHRPYCKGIRVDCDSIAIVSGQDRDNDFTVTVRLFVGAYAFGMLKRFPPREESLLNNSTKRRAIQMIREIRREAGV